MPKIKGINMNKNECYECECVSECYVNECYFCKSSQVFYHV